VLPLLSLPFLLGQLFLELSTVWLLPLALLFQALLVDQLATVSVLAMEHVFAQLLATLLETFALSEVAQLVWKDLVAHTHLMCVMITICVLRIFALLLLDAISHPSLVLPPIFATPLLAIQLLVASSPLSPVLLTVPAILPLALSLREVVSILLFLATDAFTQLQLFAPKQTAIPAFAMEQREHAKPLPLTVMMATLAPTIIAI
jgi:hypothetical protein